MPSLRVGSMSLSHCGIRKVVEFLLLIISPCLSQIRFSGAELSGLLLNNSSHELASSWGPLILGEEERKSSQPETGSGGLSCGLWPETREALGMNKGSRKKTGVGTRVGQAGLALTTGLACLIPASDPRCPHLQVGGGLPAEPTRQIPSRQGLGSDPGTPSPLSCHCLLDDASQPFLPAAERRPGQRWALGRGAQELPSGGGEFFTEWWPRLLACENS